MESDAKSAITKSMKELEDLKENVEELKNMNREILMILESNTKMTNGILQHINNVQMAQRADAARRSQMMNTMQGMMGGFMRPVNMQRQESVNFAEEIDDDKN